jgi:type VI secretion system protein VasD
MYESGEASMGKRLTKPVRAVLTATAVLAAVNLLACKSAPAPPPVVASPPIIATVMIVVAPDVNPNGSGRPSPVFLRLYQLRDGAKFLNSEFDDVTTRSDQVLAATLIGRDERMVQPGTTMTLSLAIAPEARLLGVVAEYRDLANSQWRAVSPAPAGGVLTLFKDHSLMVTVGRDAVTVSVIASIKGK